MDAGLYLYSTVFIAKIPLFYFGADSELRILGSIGPGGVCRGVTFFDAEGAVTDFSSISLGRVFEGAVTDSISLIVSSSVRWLDGATRFNPVP